MGTIYLNVTAPSGGSYAATIERLSDNYYREDDAETFGTGLVFADKDITLTEGSAENRGSYVNTVTADTWNDGVYRLRAHNLNLGNKVEGVQDFGVVSGGEVTVGEANPIYHHDIKFTVDGAVNEDEYMVNFFKNGVQNTTASGVLLTVLDVTGSYLISGEAMTEVGNTGTFQYTTASAPKRQTAGTSYSVDVTAVIDEANRNFAWILGRDST